MRVIAGRFAGVPLKVPRSGTRPTTDRTKQAIFSHLDAEGILAPGASVLDLYAGSGALGVEALSRGADRALFVDRSGQAVRAIRSALSLLERRRGWDREAMSARVLRMDAGRAVDRLAAGGSTPHRPSSLAGGLGAVAPFTLVFLDPPYETDSSRLSTLVARILTRGLVRAGGELVLERSTRTQPIPLPAGWQARPPRRYGETAVTYVCRA